MIHCILTVLLHFSGLHLVFVDIYVHSYMLHGKLTCDPVDFAATEICTQVGSRLNTCTRVNIQYENTWLPDLVVM